MSTRYNFYLTPHLCTRSAVTSVHTEITGRDQKDMRCQKKGYYTQSSSHNEHKGAVMLWAMLDFFFPSASDLLREVKDMSAVLRSHQKISMLLTRHGNLCNILCENEVTHIKPDWHFKKKFLRKQKCKRWCYPHSVPPWNKQVVTDLWLEASRMCNSPSQA